MEKAAASDLAAVEFRSVTTCVPGTREKILNGITGIVPSGTVLNLLGPSGSGKSTLLSLCNLLLTPDEGTVYILGKEVRDWQIPELRRTVGMVFQTPTMFAGTVLDNLLLGSQLRGETLSNPEHFLEQVGLPASLLTRDARELSGGQKQRIALARTLINDPEILLMDEITSALDPGAAREIEELIRNILSQHHKTVLWVTHDMEQARRIGQATWLIVNGEVVEAAPTKTLFENPANPITRRFLQGDL